MSDKAPRPVPAARAGARNDAAPALFRLLSDSALARATVNACTVPIAVLDARSDGLPLVEVNRAFEAEFGFRAAELLGRSVAALVPRDDDLRAIDAMLARHAPGLPCRLQVQLRRHDGTETLADIGIDAARGADGGVSHWVLTLLDRSALAEAREELDLLKEIALPVGSAPTLADGLRIVLERVCAQARCAFGEAWGLDDTGSALTRLQSWDATGGLLSGFARRGDALPIGGGVAGRAWIEQVPQWVASLADERDDPRRDPARAVGLKAALAVPVMAGARVHLVLVFYLQQSRARDERLVHLVRAIADQLGLVVLRKRAEERIRFLAYRDELTGLANRSLFNHLLDHALARAGQNGRRLALLYLDIDRLKAVNDALGHDRGDALLAEVGRRLTAAFRGRHALARLGGDEFGLLAEDCDTREDALAVGRDALAAIRRPFVLEGNDYRLAASVGIAVFPDDGLDAATLLKRADLAMYRTKELGGNDLGFYSGEPSPHSRERLQLENDLRQAIERGELTLHFQPRVDAASGRLAGAEALVRWNHPRLGRLPPDRFIGLAEETGLIVPLGNWVVSAACEQMARWQALFPSHFQLSINLSARQFYDVELAGRIAATLRSRGIEAARVEFELTESMLMKNPEAAAEVLAQLKRTGVRLALDDFGTGYSSLGHLKRFPIDTLKIDRSFVREIPDNRDDVAIARAIIALAATMRLRVVAEGVESDAQLAVLRQYGCDEYQGALSSMPLAPREFEERFLMAG